MKFLAFAFFGTLGLLHAAPIVVETVDLSPAPEPQAVKEFSKVLPAGEAKVKIEVDWERPGQEMEGIGGTFNEQGWAGLEALPQEARAKVLASLFDTKKGAAMRFNRIPIGSSDFGLSAYSLAETKDDYELKDFSIKRDEGCLIPYIKAAQAINPQMKFHASPWSPPGWMKTNGSQTGGGDLKDDDRTLKAHADYFVKFLLAYKSHGITVQRLLPQNEPLVAGGYPGCKNSAPVYAKALKNFIVPAVKAAKLPTEVWAGTFNYWKDYTGEHYKGILADEELAKSVGGIAFQYSHLPWVREYMAKYPKMKMIFSESQCYYGENKPEQALRDFEDFAAYVRAGARLYTYWNMVLPEPRKSTWGWCQNSPVSLDKEKKTVTWQPSFAVARLLGRHVVPGAKYLPAKVTTGDEGIGGLHYPASDGLGFMQSDLAGGEQVVAFKKPDGAIVVYLVNQGEETRAQVKVGKRTFDAMLPAKALVAIVLKKS